MDEIRKVTGEQAAQRAILSQIEDEIKRRGGPPSYKGVPLSRRYIFDSGVGAARLYFVDCEEGAELYLEVYESAEPDTVVARALDPADKKTSRRFYGSKASMVIQPIVDYLFGVAENRVRQREINDAYRAGREAMAVKTRAYAWDHMDTAKVRHDVLEIDLGEGATARMEFYLQEMAPMYKASLTFLTPTDAGIDAVIERLHTLARLSRQGSTL
ncbi:MAG: hypothetical protein IPK79_00575 [Vampirovibrionales bacterium]|nr:hypothetical protein [Vampirovibrionales bacterium]